MTTKKKTTKKQKPKTKKEETMETVEAPAVEVKNPEPEVIEDGLTYKALAMGREGKNNKWAAIMVTISNGRVIKKEVIESGGGKSSALAKTKIQVVKTLSREEATIL